MGFWRNLERSIDQFFDFSPAVYRREIEPLSEPQLRRLHAQIQRKVLGSTVGAGASVAAAPATLGASLALTAISARRMDVNSQRLDVIEARLREKGWTGNDFDMGDFLLGVGPVALGHLIPGADHVGHHLVDRAVDHAAGTLAAHHGTNHMVEQGANHLAHMAGNHGAGAGDMIVAGGRGTVQAAHEAVYKSTHTGFQQWAESQGADAIHAATKKAGGKVASLAVSSVMEKLNSDRAKAEESSSTRKPVSSPAPGKRPDKITAGDGGVSKAAREGSRPIVRERPGRATTTGPSKPPPATKPTTQKTHVSSATITTTTPVRPTISARERGITRIMTLLYPVLVHTLFGDSSALPVLTASALLIIASLILRREQIPRISAFFIPALVLCDVSSAMLWMASIGIVGLDRIGWAAVFRTLVF
ncbi:hypothetical protein QBC47DRAFT_458116 [Echria macrotheca]|uniref:Uncharacterized protein n=1 Tax=Echria macrotheca TaxID=438768 RepID=A0AAJ0FAB4_9PEZI|nr:hypothetical protein QBC47DRAFT_458116 [Echria macrotheca]